MNGTILIVILIAALAFLIAAIICHKRAERLKSTYRVGYIASYLVLVGLLGLVLLILGVVNAIAGKAGEAKTLLLYGAMGIVLGAAAFLLERRKVPAELRSPAKLLPIMLVVGVAAAWELTLRVGFPIIKFIVYLVFRIELKTPGRSASGGPQRYICTNVNISGSFYLYNEDDFGGFMRDEQGNDFRVTKWRSSAEDWIDGMVEDESGNHYRPV